MKERLSRTVTVEGRPSPKGRHPETDIDCQRIDPEFGSRIMLRQLISDMETEVDNRSLEIEITFIVHGNYPVGEGSEAAYQADADVLKDRLRSKLNAYGLLLGPGVIYAMKHQPWCEIKFTASGKMPDRSIRWVVYLLRELLSHLGVSNSLESLLVTSKICEDFLVGGDGGEWVDGQTHLRDLFHGRAT